MSRSSINQRTSLDTSTVMVAVLLVIGFAITGILFMPGHDGPESRPLLNYSYTLHAVITIEGDAEFATIATSEGWPGNGNRNNPYIISGYEIDGLAYRNAVFIGNTTVFFVVRDCYVHDSHEAGIVLWTVTNAVLQNNTCMNNDPWGIRLVQCSDSTVANNTCSCQRTYHDEYAAGIYLTSCNSITLSGNDCSNNVFDYNGNGILGSCQNCVVNNNTCIGNGDRGIRLSGNGNLISKNRCSDNNYGIDFWGSSTAEGNTCTGNTGYGIYAASLEIASYPTVRVNNCTTNQRGIGGSGIHGGTISLNNCTGNALHGILVSGASSWLISENNCSGNGISLTALGNGIGLGSHTDFVTVDRNTCNDNVVDGISVSGLYGYPSASNTVSNNSCHRNGWSGISTDYASRTLIADNNCSFNNRAGMELSGVYHTLVDNMMFGDGVVLAGGRSEWGLNSIDESNLVNGKPVFYLVDDVAGSVSGDKGQVILANCRHSRVEGVRADNASNGIALGHCENVTVSNSTAMGNTIAGISLISSPYSVLSNDTCSYNHVYGVLLSSSDYTTVSNSTCGNNNYGIRLLACYYNALANDTCSFNAVAGIHIDMDWSRHNTVAYCRLENNAQYGVKISSGAFDLILSSSAYDAAEQAGESLTVSAARMPLPPPQGGYNLIYGNMFLNNSAFDDDWGGGMTSWNLSGYGNYWSDWQSPDANLDGIVDYPRLISGQAGAHDYYPLTILPPQPVPELPQLGAVFVVVALSLAICAVRRFTHKD